MFLVTPEFTARVSDIIKVVPRKGLNPDAHTGSTEGTNVFLKQYSTNVQRLDIEFTYMPYEEVVLLLGKLVYRRENGY